VEPEAPLVRVERLERRLARDLGFPLDARPGDLDASQWAGLHVFLSNTDDLGRVGRSP
jgi:hypothetical protein